MLSLDQYISKRKKEDNLNEFNLSDKSQNIKKSIDYVFEYYNGYLDLTEIQYQESIENNKLAKYRRKFIDFDKDIQDYLVEIYDKTKKYLNKYLNDFIIEDPIFWLYDNESEWRSLSYECYAQLVRKFPMLKGNHDFIFKYLREYHRIHTEEPSLEKYDIELSRLPKVMSWVDKTFEEYNVNILYFVENYCDWFFNHQEQWDVKYKSKAINNPNIPSYDCRHSKNLFNLNSLYPKINGKSFIRGKRRELETLLLLYWVRYIDDFSKDMIDDYLNKNYKL